MEQKFDEQKYLKLYDELGKKGLFTSEGLSAFKNLKRYLIDCGERFEDRGRLYLLLTDTWGAVCDFKLESEMKHILGRPIASYIPFTRANIEFKKTIKSLEEKAPIANQLEKACVFTYQEATKQDAS